MLHSYNIFDAQDKDRPVKTQLRVQPLIYESNIVEMRLHKLELSDDLFTPWQTPENVSYLQVAQVKEQSTYGHELETKVVNIVLGDEISIENRIRYNLWDLLGDVGGFDGGLMLISTFLTTAYSAISFKTAYLSSVLIDAGID